MYSLKEALKVFVGNHLPTEEGEGSKTLGRAELISAERVKQRFMKLNDLTLYGT